MNIRSCMYPRTKEERRTLDLTWRSLPDYTDNKNAIAVVDGSASMYLKEQGLVTPITVAVSLGLYFAERSEGYFHNHFITFSENPRLVEVKGVDIVRKTEYRMGYNECSNTDLERVFELLLFTAVQQHLPQKKLPEIIYIISDMEFDEQMGTDKTIFQMNSIRFAEMKPVRFLYLVAIRLYSVLQWIFV